MKRQRFLDYGLWLNDRNNGTDSTTVATLMTTLLPAQKGSQKYHIQLNTLRSISYLRPEIDVVVFSNDTSVHEMCDTLGIQVITDYESNLQGTPFIRSLFEQLETDLSTSPLLGYFNADIVFDTSLKRTLEVILQNLRLIKLCSHRSPPKNNNHKALVASNLPSPSLLLLLLFCLPSFFTLTRRIPISSQTFAFATCQRKDRTVLQCLMSL